VRRARIAELKNNLSRFLDYVRSGDTVLVLDRDRPIARIVPLSHPGGDQADREGWLDDLERQGLIRRGRGGLPDWLGRRKPVRVKGSVLRDFLQERGTGW
jgi:prevent-host-death family protein